MGGGEMSIFSDSSFILMHKHFYQGKGQKNGAWDADNVTRHTAGECLVVQSNNPCWRLC